MENICSPFYHQLALFSYAISLLLPHAPFKFHASSRSRRPGCSDRLLHWLDSGGHCRGIQFNDHRFSHHRGNSRSHFLWHRRHRPRHHRRKPFAQAHLLLLHRRRNCSRLRRLAHSHHPVQPSLLPLPRTPSREPHFADHQHWRRWDHLPRPHPRRTP